MSATIERVRNVLLALSTVGSLGSACIMFANVAFDLPDWMQGVTMYLLGLATAASTGTATIGYSELQELQQRALARRDDEVQP